MNKLFGALALIGFINSCHAYFPVSPKNLQVRQTAVPGCKKWFTTFAGDSCTTVAAFNDITVDDFIKWNPSLKKGVCDEIILPDTQYCVGIQQTTTKTTTTAKPTTTGNGISTPSPIQTGMIKSCNKFHLVAEGQSCPNIVSKYPGTSIDLLFKWNPAIGKTCTSMWAKTYLCVGVIGGTPTTKATTTAAKTTASNGTPSPIGKNTTKNCKKWAYIRAGDTCQTILNRNKDVKSTLKDLVRWNPSVKADCSGLLAKYYLCIAGPAAPTPTTTKPKTTAVNPTPTPVQPGQVKNCKGWAYVKSGQTCQDIIKAKPTLKLTLAQLYAWNPAIGKDCSKMWAKSYLCVQVK
ncbi:hypothetical protein TWF506_009249 [Arthrobotrys conoides]|uniref:LysM domain-containing protein n=1 Tax=Arthrobotrys conoides TaxID=74498 RepID=A0AAN8NDG6_9PEZI